LLTAFISTCQPIGRKNRFLYFLLTAFILTCCNLAVALQGILVRLHAALTVFTHSVAVCSAVCFWAGHTLMAEHFQLLQEDFTKIQGSDTLCFQKHCL